MKNNNEKYNFVTFHCSDCGYSKFLDLDQEDPTTSTGCCKVCGSNKWTMKNDNGETIG